MFFKFVAVIMHACNHVVVSPPTAPASYRLLSPALSIGTYGGEIDPESAKLNGSMAVQRLTSPQNTAMAVASTSEKPSFLNNPTAIAQRPTRWDSCAWVGYGTSIRRANYDAKAGQCINGVRALWRPDPLGTTHLLLLTCQSKQIFWPNNFIIFPPFHGLCLRFVKILIYITAI
jgi:hypothetical protein